ncbi:MAG: hypothetical protein AABW49_01880 [Nanoarchaeota archaeon]
MGIRKKVKSRKIKDARFKPKTYVITAAQGIQNPYHAFLYGRDPSKGKVIRSLLQNIERYVGDNNGELRIDAIPGSYISERSLDPILHDRPDVFMEKNAKTKLAIDREKERAKRAGWEARKLKAEEREIDFDASMPMHYFWEEIPDENYEATGKRLNSNMHELGIPEPPQNQNPLAGKALHTRMDNGISFVMGSTKQMLEPVASGQSSVFPRLMFASGAITRGNYNCGNRVGFTADSMHELGFFVVDILDDKLYLPRLVPANANGMFVDLGMKYALGKDPEKIRPIVLMFGDSHVSEMDPVTHRANLEMLTWFKPKHLHVNDIFNAQSVTPHDKDKALELMYKAEAGEDDLEKELVGVRDYLVELSSYLGDGEIVINYSNHDDMLRRWLEKGEDRRDPKNSRLGSLIFGKMQKYMPVLEVALKEIGTLPPRVRFLKLGEDAIYEGVQCGAHGDRGKNNSRGSLKSLSDGYIRAMMGHVHQPAVRHKSMSCGTSSKIPLDYQLGAPSTSMAGNGVLYPGGLMQALPIINGRWRK